MFTEQACVTIVELSARDDGSLIFSILPAGSSRHELSGDPSAVHVDLPWDLPTERSAMSIAHYIKTFTLWEFVKAHCADAEIFLQAQGDDQLSL